MWNFTEKSKIPETADEKQVRNNNVWIFILTAFMIIWMIGAYFYLEQTPSPHVSNPPVIVLDEAGGLNIMTNLFTMGANQQLLSKSDVHPKFTQKTSYSYGEIVVVKYFYVEAVVLEHSTVGDNYIVIYKDHNHVLQKISLPRTFLMSPSDGALSPVSLLVD